MTDRPPPAGLDGLRRSYRSGSSSIGEDFFAPCLAACSTYDRASAYFTSHALAVWAASVPALLVRHHVAAIRLVVGPTLLREDRATLMGLQDPGAAEAVRQGVSDRMLADAVEELAAGEDSARLPLFVSLLASGVLSI